MPAYEEPDEDKGKSLTRREWEILVLRASGLSNQDIAERLVISPDTVKNHVYSIGRKLGMTVARIGVYWFCSDLACPVRKKMGGNGGPPGPVPNCRSVPVIA